MVPEMVCLIMVWCNSITQLISHPQTSVGNACPLTDAPFIQRWMSSLASAWVPWEILEWCWAGSHLVGVCFRIETNFTSHNWGDGEEFLWRKNWIHELGILRFHYWLGAWSPGALEQTGRGNFALQELPPSPLDMYFCTPRGIWGRDRFKTPFKMG